MSFRKRLFLFVNSIISRFGFELLQNFVVYDWQRNPQTVSIYNKSNVPKDAADYLQVDNPRLLELQERYNNFNSKVTIPTVWTNGYISKEELIYFRGDNGYVWQLRGANMNIMSYTLSTFYLKSVDKLGLLEQLIEDNHFGNFCFDIDNKKVSRDLIDSILELNFLEKHLQLSTQNDFKVLDIGAGYGRLAHRMLEAFPNIKNYYCTDAIATSTFLSEYYLKFRNLEGRGKVVPLDEIESCMDKNNIDLAINIHSFSECSIQAIEWWLSLLANYKVKYLMVVPNAFNNAGELLLTNDQKDMSKIIYNYGYRQIVKEAKFIDPLVQKYAINPTHYYLFELTNN